MRNTGSPYKDQSKIPYKINFKSFNWILAQAEMTPLRFLRSFLFPNDQTKNSRLQGISLNQIGLSADFVNVYWSKPPQKIFIFKFQIIFLTEMNLVKANTK